MKHDVAKSGRSSVTPSTTSVHSLYENRARRRSSEEILDRGSRDSIDFDQLRPE